MGGLAAKVFYNKSGWVLLVCLLLPAALLSWLTYPFWYVAGHGAFHPVGYNALMDAIDAKDVAAVESLMKDGINPNTYPHADIDLMAEDDITPLNSAAGDGNNEIVGILLDHGADPNLGDGWSTNPLCSAIENGHIETMALLVKRGAKVNDQLGGSSALWSAAIDWKVNAVRFLLAHGANPNTRMDTESLLGALHSRGGSEEVIAILKHHGAKE